MPFPGGTSEAQRVQVACPQGGGGVEVTFDLGEVRLRALPSDRAGPSLDVRGV